MRQQAWAGVSVQRALGYKSFLSNSSSQMAFSQYQNDTMSNASIALVLLYLEMPLDAVATNQQ